MLKAIILIFALGAIFIYPLSLLLFAFINFCIVAIKNLFSYFIFNTNSQNNSKCLNSQKLNENFVSVLVAIYNEPPLLVNNTLLSLSKQNYKNYEVLVLDNNTSNETVWKPVQKFCEELGVKFKFYHVENLRGFKAGALNWLMKKVNPKSKYVAIIDADYQSDPDFLVTTVNDFTDQKIAFVQLPQAYSNVSELNRGLAIEYEYFFDNYMIKAQNLECVNATGTLGMFNIEMLKKLGGFNTSTITEDAELGTRIALAGYKGIYVPKIMGKGLMPHNLLDLKLQRIRWAVGNAQVLRKYFFSILKSPYLNWKQKFSLYSQLMAWANFTFPATFLIILIATFKLFSFSLPSWDAVFITSLATIVLFLVLKLFSFYLTFKDKYGKPLIIRAFLVHIGINYVYSMYYFSGLMNLQFDFVRTNKFLNKNIPGIFSTIFGELIFVFFLFLLSIGLLSLKEYFYFFTMIIITSITLTILFTLKETTATETESKKIFIKIKNMLSNLKI